MPPKKRRRIATDEEEEEAEEQQTNEPSDDDDVDEEEEQAATKKKGKKKKPAQKLRRNKKTDDDNEFEGEKSTPTSALTDAEREDIVSSFLRYALFCNTNKLPIRKDNFTKQVKIPKGGFAEILELTQQKLKSVFGFELVPAAEDTAQQQPAATAPATSGDQQPPKKKKKNAQATARIYLLVLASKPDERTTLSQEQIAQRSIEFTDLSQVKIQGLLHVIVALVYGHSNNMPEEQLWDALHTHFFVQKNNDRVFGNTEALVNEFCKQLYLEKKKDELTASTNPDAEKTPYKYSLGARSKHELSIDGINRLIGNKAPQQQQDSLAMDAE